MHESSRLKHACAKENVTSVDELVSLLNQKGQKQTQHPTRHISLKTSVHHIHCVR